MTAVRVWWTCFRIARRELGSHLWAAIVMVIFVALPVAGVTTYLIVSTTAAFTTEERVQRALGTADARLTVLGAEADRNQVAALVSSDESLTRIAPQSDRTLLLEGETTLGRGNQQVAVTLNGFATDSPLAASILLLQEGALPTGADEVALSMRAAERLGVAVGDRVDDSATGRSLVISGLQLDPVDTAALFATVDLAGTYGFANDATVVYWLIRAPADVLAELATLGPVLDRAEVLARIDPPDELAAIAVFVAAQMLVAVIVGAGFASIAHRQRRQFVLMAAVGGSRWMRSLVATGMGVVVAIAALVAGFGLGVVASLLAVPALEERAQQDWGGLALPWISLAATASVVVLGCAGAAAVAGRATVRDPWRTPQGPRRVTRRRVRTSAVAVFAVIVGITIGVLTESVLLLGAAIVVAVAYSGVAGVAGLQVVERRASRMPVTARIAVRDAAATTARPVMLAVAVTSIVAVATCASFLLPALIGGDERYVAVAPFGGSVFTSDQQPSPPAVSEAAIALGATSAATYQEAIRVDPETGLTSYLQVDNPFHRCVTESAQPATGTACAERTGFAVRAPLVAAVPREDIAAFVGTERLSVALDAYDSGLALVMHSALVNAEEKLTITANTGPSALDGALQPFTFTLPAVVVADVEHLQTPMVLLAEAAVVELGLSIADQTSTLFTGSSPPPASAEDDARGVLLAGTSNDGVLVVERGDPGPAQRDAITRITMSAVIVLSLSILVAGMALSTGELREIFAVLAVVGGGPALRRRIAAGQAVVIATSGAIPGAILGATAAACLVTIEGMIWTWQPLGPLLLSLTLLVGAAWVVGWLMAPVTRTPPKLVE